MKHKSKSTRKTTKKLKLLTLLYNFSNMKVNNIIETIGKRRVVRLSKIFPDQQVWMKLEKTNPAGSSKDRISLAMIQEAEASGKINKDTVIIETTYGNKGVGLAMVCAYKGFILVLVML